MSNRLYQITAIAILIGAPIVVNLVSNAIPGIQQAAQANVDNRQVDRPVEADSSSKSGEIARSQARPLSSSSQFTASNPDAPLDVTPSLDVQGIAPDAASGDAGFSPPPAAPPINARPVLQAPPQRTDGPPPPMADWQRQ